MVAKDGKIFACYKAKGKKKGQVRLVAKRAKCKSGERRTTWNQVGVGGAQGAAGRDGAGGTNGGTDLLATVRAQTQTIKLLQSQVSTMLSRTASLESKLNGVNAGQLSALTGMIPGLTGLIPQVNALCTQVPLLNTQLNLLHGVIGGLGLNSVLTVLGGLLSIPSLPAVLAPFNCPTR